MNSCGRYSKSPIRDDRSEDFPEPTSPMMQTNSPFLILMSRFFTATKFSIVRVSCYFSESIKLSYLSPTLLRVRRCSNLESFLAYRASLCAPLLASPRLPRLGGKSGFILRPQWKLPLSLILMASSPCPFPVAMIVSLISSHIKNA